MFCVGRGVGAVVVKVKNVALLGDVEAVGERPPAVPGARSEGVTFGNEIGLAKGVEDREVRTKC